MKKGLSRRNLFKFMAAGGTSAVAAGCEQKPEKIIPALVTPVDFEYMPNTGYQYMTTCRECDSGACGMMIQLVSIVLRKQRATQIILSIKGHCVLLDKLLSKLYTTQRDTRSLLLVAVLYLGKMRRANL